jgi:hypothetical protein
MQPIGALDLTAALQARGVDLATLGAAYLALLCNLLLAIVTFITARNHLVIAPNRGARDYGIYVAMTLAAFLVATVLENELLPRQSITLHYVAVPHVLLLLLIHLWIAFRPEPWLVALGLASSSGAILTVALTALVSDQRRVGYWLTAALLLALLVILWMRSISTKRGFLTARSIYVKSKETPDEVPAPQKAWLGLAHWVALAGASVALAVLNSMLRGAAIAQIPALQMLIESGLVMAVTLFVCAVPATSYWLARRAWMPELTRFVWLVWIVVSFAFTYGNYLTSLDRV